MRLIDIINAPMQENDANAKTIGEYLRTLLLTLWEEQEGFSGKRPFGNSGWDYELYIALINCGAVDGQLDDDDYLESVDYRTADKTIYSVINAIFDAVPVVHGKWIYVEDIDIQCSVCGAYALKEADYPKESNYCPNCGAKMDG